MSVSTWYCQASGKNMDSYDDEFTGENINCVALATTGDTTGKGEDNLIRLGKSHYLIIF